jgi:predicted  nucleic acid-binding Zn-ribbon protein
VAIDLKKLKEERDTLKDQLRKLEVQQREIEAKLKGFRQQEIRSKREIEALTTLIELAENKAEPAETTTAPPA